MYNVTPQDWIALLVDKAPHLRAAGVMSISIDGDRVNVGLAPPYEPLEAKPAAGSDVRPAPPDDPQPEPEPDALDDPATFGGPVPGYQIDDEEAE